MLGDPWNWSNFQPSNATSGRHAFGGGYVKTGEKSILSIFFNGLLDRLIDRVAPCPWSCAAGSHETLRTYRALPRKQLYTPIERQRRDSTGWTLVQGILAPVQFAVFLISLGLVLHFLLSGQGYAVAAASVVVKTFVLYAIMVTGAIWEKKVFGKYLFADAFFWEDTVSMLVIGLHTAYLAAILTGWGSAQDRMILALAAYTTYAVNAAQFLMKLRAARLEAPRARNAAQ